MHWIALDNTQKLEEIIRQSQVEKVLVFKHSTRCSISNTALSRLERTWPDDAKMKMYFLDLLAHRNISDAIAQKFSVVHQSPQVIIIEKGKSIYNCSHFDINAEEILKALQ